MSPRSNTSKRVAKFDSGPRTAKLESARANLDAVFFSRKYSMKRNSFEIGRRFFFLAFKHESLLAYRRAEETAKRSQEIAQTRYDSGTGQYSIKLLSDSNLAEARLDKITAEGDYAVAMTELTSYALQDGSKRIRLLYPREIDSALSDDFLSEIESAIANKRLSNLRLLAAQAKVLAAQANLDAVSSEDLPKIELVLSANRDSSQASGYVGQTNRGTSAILQVGIPLTDGFTRGNKIGRAGAVLDRQRAELKELEREIDTIAWTNFEKVKFEILRVKSIRTLNSSASISLTTAQDRFEAGVGDIFEIFKAEQDLAKSAQLLSRSKYELRIALLQLFLELEGISARRLFE